MKLDIVNLSILGIIGTLAFFTLISSCSEINSGEAGIVTIFGKPTPELLDSGIHFMNPFSKVHKIDLQVRTVSQSSEAASSDLQKVDTTLTLNYKLDYKNVMNTFVKVSQNDDYLENAIVKPYINEVFKSVVAHYTAENLINKRDAVSIEIQKLLNTRLNAIYMDVVSISVTDFKFSKAFDSAIEKKVTAQQEVLTTQNLLAQQKIQNEITISKAQTESQAVILKAEADAKALALKKSTLTPELIQLNAVEKWDGKLPIYSGNSLPFLKFDK